MSLAARRWVLDTNVVLSALIRPGGITGRLRLAWQADLFVPLVNSTTAAELIRVLAYPKFTLDIRQQHELLADYLPWSEVIAITNPPPFTPACRDPLDVPFLQLALSENAEALITGDADLLCLAPIADLDILGPARAIELLTNAVSMRPR